MHAKARRMLEPAGRVVFPTKGILKTGRETMKRCRPYKRVTVRRLEKARLEEMPGICPGWLKDLCELLLLSDLRSIHLTMHGVTRLVRIACGSLGRCDRGLPLLLLQQFVFTNQLLKRSSVECGYLPCGELPFCSSHEQAPLSEESFLLWRQTQMR